MQGGCEAEEPPEWLTQNYPGLAKVTMAVTECLRKSVSDPAHELEIRLGRVSDRFNPDCEFELIDQFMNKCGGTKRGTLTFTPWVEHVDYFYLFDQDTVRSRVEYDSDTCEVSTTTTKKQLVTRHGLRCAASEWNLRVDLSAEQVIQASKLPKLVHPTRVCISHRCSANAVCKHGDTDEPIWRYDITMRWDAATRTAAEAKQRNTETPPAHVIELEYVGGAQAIERHGAVYIACSGLLKALDIVNMTGTQLELSTKFRA
jgi:hypothetical protein